MIAVVNYGMGNLGSVKNAFDYIGVDSFVSEDAKKLSGADALVLPGVGAFGDAMINLRKHGLEETVLTHIDSGRPFLGICLGLQMLFESSAESPGVKGLGVISGTVEKFPEEIDLKIPQIGWNSIEVKDSMPVLGEFNESYMYFVHSYFAQPDNMEQYAIKTRYGMDFTSAVEYKNILACQFHPEKSGKTGLAILKKWIDLYL